MGAGDVPVGGVYDTRSVVRQVEQDCKEVRDGVGPNGNWCIDFHQRFELNDALRLCQGASKTYEPFFVEDPVRDENALQDIPKLRQMTDRPADPRRRMGTEVGLQPARREPRRRLHPIDAAQRRRHHRDDEGAAICETHAVGIIPHFTGPIATAALVNCLSTFSGPVLMEYNYGGRPIDYLPECLDFKNGKAYTNQRPGLGVTLDMNRLTLIGEVTEPGRKKCIAVPMDR